MWLAKGETVTISELSVPPIGAEVQGRSRMAAYYKNRELGRFRNTLQLSAGHRELEVYLRNSSDTHRNASVISFVQACTSFSGGFYRA
jgi:hypothetical protein